MAADTGGPVLDFAVAAYLEEGIWQVVALPLKDTEDLAAILAALRQLPADAGALGMVSVADDFFVLLRVRGPDVRLVLSDATAAEDWALARQALEQLGIDPDDEELEEGPVGDLGAFADLGLSELDLSMIVEDLDAYPDESLGTVAERLGFGSQFERAVEGAS